MPKTTYTKIFLLILALTTTYLQGCNVSQGGGSTAADNPAGVRLALDSLTGSTTLMADGVSSVPLQLSVVDGSGQGMAEIPVTFRTTAGLLSASTGTTASRAETRAAAEPTSTATSMTGSNGTADVVLTSSTTTGSATVTAEAMGFSTAITIDFISGIPTQVALRAIPSTVGVGQTATLRATVTDADDLPVEGVTVTVSLATNNSGASLAPTTAPTDANGQASFTYTAGSTFAIDTVQAEISGGVTDSVLISVQAVSVAAEYLDLLVSSPQLDSDGTEAVTLTALVRDANNNFASGVEVTFVADSGGIQVTTGTTDATGTASALLSTAGDPTNRTIMVTATAGMLASTNNVEVTGTTLNLSGANSLVLGETTTLSILLRDSSGQGIANQDIAFSSELGNTLNAETVTTDTHGQATVDVTATASGTDTIQATALGVSGTTSLTVSSANFVFRTPAAGTEVPLGVSQPITVHWDEAGINQVGQPINFFATRGNLSAPSVMTNGNGDATVRITSANAGPAVLTAATTPDGPSSQIEIEFVATTPISLILQASPMTLGINAEGSTDQQSIVTAVVRDASGNLVKNQTVSFTLSDVSGGSIFPASAITDSFGRASTVYKAGASVSAQDGVIIDAEVTGTVGCVPTDPIPTGPCDRVTLTVAQQALFVTVGTSHLIQPLSDTQYAKPYSVLVTDANGNPVQGAEVELNVYPIRYEKGYYVAIFDGDECKGWVKSRTVTAASALPNPDNADQACNNEDVNRDGLLNPGEDINNNGTLEPGNVATAPDRVITDASGFALFDLVYAREFTWIEIELEARATVAGSEASSKARFFLPGLAADFEDCDIAPPGVLSPYGQATTCGCDELTDPTCPL